MNITYRSDVLPDSAVIISVYDSSGINRPTADKERITRMYQNSNLVVTAWQGDVLVGVARSLTDFCYSCYLADLAVRKEYQHLGIGKELIRLTKEIVGDQTTLILLSAPAAMGYYPKIGMEQVDSAFVVRRKG